MFQNVYEDPDYAAQYAGLDWGGTYHLVRRDLPGLLEAHVTGRRALDFGCGTGRSTRLLRALGFDAAGVDVSPSMIQGARLRDPDGDYRLLAPGELERWPAAGFDLVLAAFPFDNIPAADKPPALAALGRLLGPAGRLVLVGSTPEIYTHEWASFTTRPFPENRLARDGEVVRIVTTTFDDPRPAEDVRCSDRAYREAFGRAGLEVIAAYRPLASDDEPGPWINETRVAPWVIYVLSAASGTAGVPAR